MDYCPKATSNTRPHAVCIPHPTQGHINPMLNLAKLFHYRSGFHVTFVNTLFNHKRLLKSEGRKSLDISPDFCFEAIPDGLPPPTGDDDDNAMQFIPDLCESIRSKRLLDPLRELLAKLNGGPSGPLVLSHLSIGGFLTHCGSILILESLSAGVPMICRPFMSEQPTNCRFLCTEWGVGVEMDGEDVKREEVEMAEREFMDGEKGEEMRWNAVEYKRRAEEAVAPSGSSWLNFDKMVNEVLMASCSPSSSPSLLSKR